MRILPVGTTASNLAVFWPLWDAALLRRYGRGRIYPMPAPVALAVARGLAARKGRGPVSLLPHRLLILPYADPHPPAPPPELVARLDLRWPSDTPPPRRDTVVEYRWLPPPELPGEFCDLIC